MSEANKHTDSYNEADIRRYLEGKMSPAEMNAFEKATLDDPFLADALEGIQQASVQFSPAEVSSKLDEARQQLAHRVKKDKPGSIISFPWKQLSVAAALLLIAGFWIYNSVLKSDAPAKEAIARQDNPPAPLAMDSISSIEKRPDTASTSTPPSPVLTVTENSSAAEKSTLPQKQEPDLTVKDKPVTDTKKEDNPISPVTSHEAGRKKETSSGDDLKSREPNRAAESRARQSAPASPSRENKSIDTEASQTTIADADKPAPQFLNGKVVDNNNKPIANASVIINDSKSSYLTDQQGNFKVPSSDSVVDATVAVIGYASQHIQLKNNVALNKVQLQPDNKALSEVVVTGYGNRKKEKNSFLSRFPKVMVQDAEPVTGWIEYNKYIDSSKKTFPQAAEGEVVISFTVNKKGELDGFKTEQSLSKEQDAEALRLIKEGPAWKLLKGKRTRVYVIVPF